MPSLVNEWFYLSSARFLLVKTVQYSSQRRGTPNLHLLSHPLTLRRCNLSNESNCIVCRDAPLEFLNLPWCPSPVTGIAVVPSLTQTFPRQELQCPMTNEIRPLVCIPTTHHRWRSHTILLPRSLTSHPHAPSPPTCPLLCVTPKAGR